MLRCILVCAFNCLRVCLVIYVFAGSLLLSDCDCFVLFCFVMFVRLLLFVMQTVSFCNDLGSHPKLRISRISETSGWLESKSAFKPTFSSLWSCLRLNRPFRTFDPLGPFRVPHLTKHKKLPKATTKPSVFAMVWDAIQTLGFREILERLAGLSPKVPLSQPFLLFSPNWGVPVRAPFGLGTKRPLGPLAVIPRSFRVDGNYEWVFIERKNEAFPNWERTLKQFALSPRCEIL